MRVQLAVPWTDDKAVAHRAGTKLQVTPDVGHQLIKDGFAAAAGVGEDEPETSAAPKQADKPAHHQSPSTDGDQKGAGDGRP